MVTVFSFSDGLLRHNLYRSGRNFQPALSASYVLLLPPGGFGWTRLFR
jgi:hypothetical protein